MLRFAPAVANPSVFPIFGSHLALHTAFSVSECVATQFLVSMDQTLTLPSNELCDVSLSIMPVQKGPTHLLRRYSPVLLQERDKTQPEWPDRLAICSPEEVS